MHIQVALQVWVEWIINCSSVNLFVGSVQTENRVPSRFKRGGIFFAMINMNGSSVIDLLGVLQILLNLANRMAYTILNG